MLRNKILLSSVAETQGNVTTVDDTVGVIPNTVAPVDDTALDEAINNAEPVIDASVPKVAPAAIEKIKKSDTPKPPPDYLKGLEPIGNTEDDDAEVTATPVVAAAPKVLPKTAVAAVDPSVRDYSIFQSDDEKVLRQAGNNPVFNWAKERLPKLYAAAKEAEELKVKLTEAEKGIVRVPENYNDHPEAYKLTPDYSNSVRFLQQARVEGNHWMEELAKIEDGEPTVQDIKGIDENGNLVLSDPIPVTAQVKVKLQNSLRKAEQYTSDFSSRINVLRTAHGTAHKDAVNLVSQECAKYFPWVTDDKMFKETIIEVLAEKGKPAVKVSIEQAYKDALENISPVWRNHPLAQAQANLIINSLILQQKNRIMEEKLGIQAQTKKDQERAEVSSSTKGKGISKAVNGTSLKGGDAIGSLDDLNE